MINFSVFYYKIINIKEKKEINPGILPLYLIQ